MKCPEVVNLVVCRSLGGGGMEGECLVDTRFFRVLKNVLELNRDDGCTTM